MNFLDALHYYFFAGLEAVLDFPHWAETITDFYGSNARLIVTSDHGNLIVALQFRDSFLRDKERAFSGLGRCANAGKLTRTQNVSRIWKDRFETDCTGLYIDIAIDGVKFSFL
jgi:hypothetical protein